MTAQSHPREVLGCRSSCLWKDQSTPPPESDPSKALGLWGVRGIKQGVPKLGQRTKHAQYIGTPGRNSRMGPTWDTRTHACPQLNPILWGSINSQSGSDSPQTRVFHLTSHLRPLGMKRQGLNRGPAAPVDYSPFPFQMEEEAQRQATGRRSLLSPLTD